MPLLAQRCCSLSRARASKSKGLQPERTARRGASAIVRASYHEENPQSTSSALYLTRRPCQRNSELNAIKLDMSGSAIKRFGAARYIAHRDDTGRTPLRQYLRLARNGETEIWVGGINDSILPLPELAVSVKDIIDQESINDLRKTIVQLTGLANEGDDLHHDDLELVRGGLCFRPVSDRGTPLIGRIPEKNLGGIKVGNGGVYIASGHGPWGISLSLGTGLLMSEMVLSKKTSADVRGLGLTCLGGRHQSWQY